MAEQISHSGMVWGLNWESEGENSWLCPPDEEGHTSFPQLKTEQHSLFIFILLPFEKRVAKNLNV
jgi:hypothetical protein